MALLFLVQEGHPPNSGPEIGRRLEQLAAAGAVYREFKYVEMENAFFFFFFFFFF